MYLCLGLKPLSPFVIITVHSLRPPEAHLEEVLSNAEISSKVQARVSKRQMQQAIEQSPPPKQLDQIREKVSRVQWQMPATRWRAHTHAAREGRGGVRRCARGVLLVCVYWPWGESWPDSKKEEDRAGGRDSTPGASGDFSQTFGIASGNLLGCRRQKRHPAMGTGLGRGGSLGRQQRATGNEDGSPIASPTLNWAGFNVASVWSLGQAFRPPPFALAPL